MDACTDHQDSLSTMTVSDDEPVSKGDDASERAKSIFSNQPPSNPLGQQAPEETVVQPQSTTPTENQIRIKTEASGMDAEAVEAAVKNHTDGLLLAAKAKKDLNNSGLSHTEISRRVRQNAAEKGKFEYYDFEELGVEAENFDFSIFSNPDYKPDYIQPEKVTVIPDHISERRMIKQEPDTPGRVLDGNGKPLPINRWWKPDLLETVRDPKRLTNTLVDTSADESNTTVQCDKDPSASTKTFTHFLMKPDRRSALILELSRLHPEGAIIFHDTPEEEEEKRQRKLFIERVRKTLNDSNPAGSVHLDEMLDLISENPTNFFAVKSLIDSLVDQGITDPALIVNRITFDVDLDKPVLLPGGQKEVDLNHPDPKTQEMLCAFDEVIEDQNASDRDNLLTTNLEKGDASAKGKAGDKSMSGNCFSALGTPIIGRNRFGPGLSLTVPRFSSTPRATETNKSTFFPKPPAKRSRNFSMDGFLDTTDNTPIKPEEYLRRHKVAGGYLARISDFPIQGRMTVGAWKALVRQKSLQKPTPYDYHPRYSTMPGYLSKSFSGEALPGVFRPCSSGMSELQATQAYRNAKKEEPSCLMDLNVWVKLTYPPEPVEFDPAKHSIECEGYDMDFWSEVKDLELSRTGASLSSNAIVPHCPMDRLTTDHFFKLYSEFLEPLAPYVADTMLTTLGPSFASRKNFMWWSIPVPRYKGDLVLKNALFDHNGMSFLINNASQVGRCAVCRGLLVTPHHVTFLAYFFPDGLEEKMVNASILQSWAAQRIAVCYVHAVTDAVFKPGRQLS